MTDSTGDFEEQIGYALDEGADDKTLNEVITHVKDSYNKSKDWRQQSDEGRWLQAYRNYRGLYNSDVQFTEAERSRVFIKVTKTKVLAAYGQIIDVLFAKTKFPITIDPTTLPEGVSESVYFDPKERPEETNGEELPDSPYGSRDDEEELPKGATLYSLTKRLGPLADKLRGIKSLKEGPGTTPSAVTFNPAAIAAKKMEKKIHDQLEESNASKHLRSSIFECVLFGTGILKGPFAVDKEYPSWNEEGGYEPVTKVVPQAAHVSIWDFYPDPDASNMDEALYVVQRHKLSKTQLRALKKRPFFRADAIEECVTVGSTYTREYWENDLKDYYINESPDRYEILEYWGTIDTETAKEYGMDLPKEFKDTDEIQINCWICGDAILRLVANPFQPTRIPYFAVPYELNPYSFFGIGLAENMDDTQTLMNGFMRMAVDNAVLSGNLIFEVDETNLVPGQDLKVYPGKVFRRQGGAPGQALFGTKFPNVSNENMQLFDKARQLADEATGFPSFAHGQTGVQGTGRTAAGISMLMGAAAGSIKTVIKNVDDYLLRPMGEAFYFFNMQFDHDDTIKGDLEVKARGTESLMANEVRSQRLLQYLQVVSNPVLAPFAKFPVIIREIATSLGLDPDKVTNSMEEAARQAQLIQQDAPPAPPQQPQQPGQAGAAPAGGAPGLSPADMQGGGGGTIGVGAAATPAEGQFSGQANPSETQGVG
jgi:hypothetical protein